MPEERLNLSVKNLILKYPRKTVLDNLSCDFQSGKINILMGENGAGKSSLIKIICGDIIPDSGSIFINGEQVKIKTPGDAIRHGIVCVHQRPILADGISIMENLMLGALDFNKKEAKIILSQWLPSVKPENLVRNCSGDERFFISLSGALLKKPRLLILDEPSALLDSSQRLFLFNRLKEFCKDGMNIIVITHFMDEAKKFGDCITFLEDGKVCTEDLINENTASAGAPEVQQKINHQTEYKFYLSYKNINCLPKNKPVIKEYSFTAAGGEITLISGQTEDGRETLEDFITGMSSAKQSGLLEISAPDRKFSYTIKNANFTRRKLQKSPFRFGIIPSDKTFRGSNPALSIRQLLNSENPEEIIKKAEVNITLNDKASYLSGGMLQRLILEREIAKDPDILILCEPVQGLDSRRTEKICRTIRELADSGKIVIVLSSSEFPQEICDKIYSLEKAPL